MTSTLPIPSKNWYREWRNGGLLRDTYNSRTNGKLAIGFHAKAILWRCNLELIEP